MEPLGLSPVEPLGWRSVKPGWTLMKRILRIVGIAAGVAAAAWLVKDRLLPNPTPPPGSTPAFRSPQTVASPQRPSTPAAPPTPEAGSGDDLTAIKGIGPVYAERLAEAGVTTFTGLARADAVELAGRLEVDEDKTASWIDQARARQNG